MKTEELKEAGLSGEQAEAVLKLYDRDAARLQKELQELETQNQELRKTCEEKLAARDFEDALREEAGGLRFSSDAARRAVMADIRAAALSVKDGRLEGFPELLEQLKAKDASAFAEESENGPERDRARFTRPLQAADGAAGLTKEQILGIPDRELRQREIRENMGLFE